MNILLLGSGGREHAFAHKLIQSPQCDNLFVAPGNAGTAAIAKNLDLSVTNFQAIKDTVLTHQINMVVVGPEDPLVNGIYDYFLKDDLLKDIPVIGPSKEGAQLEGSKDYAKQFMFRHNIPTAAYESFTAATVEKGHDFLETLNPPYVLKADGLAAGKGVLIINDLTEAKEELTNMLTNKKFGEASTTVVIEEFLDGIELSVFVLTDGKNYITLPTAKDYKRIGEGDTGLNTGGMGAVSPVPFADEAFMLKIENEIVKPTVNGLNKEDIDYKGFIFIGLINVDGQPKVIEYNVRMGDPETEVVLPRIESDLLEAFVKLSQGKLNDITLTINPDTAATVMAVSGGYPKAYNKGLAISGLADIKDSIVFQAGTAQDSNGIVTSGGRVLAVTSFGKNHKEALKKSYQNIENIKFDRMYYRKDLGLDLDKYL
ncbi:phosphoribosylamine--glycine ligase [Croceibacter atlanticus]|jgi:phosphoribosylamine--glycine ligase|uniref:Phosphoribosylamine--glycine ligase n=1 Tax=Croceibacter atlanticus (strain ATCC BAA-628 / JCM 21780 / CIP 108009 / IAM 15332 / KCTC 12090 / HTCC2559) TaxID=216432 RepID=A3U617_CROAH|nr:phosphoribosylamine--glycine ligase [Croceibacter atlanticus]EAP87684.1 phosphoribosylamine--glycine ligase [Croceibacter atlanticus HTCC2559]MBW4970083.1 phosphoribosylamine--glycine ligase [Croceibacter atlanticus]